jgi:hypothetical protein
MKIVLLTVLTLALGVTALAQTAAEPLGDNDIPAGISDPGHGSPYPRFLADVNNDGIKDFCRVVGEKPNLYFSCAFGERKGFGKNEYAYNSEAAKTNFGHEGTAWMQDVNGDGRMDYCRQVGAEPTKYYAAMLAGATEFSRNQFTRIKQIDNGKWAIAPAPPVGGSPVQQSITGGAAAPPAQNQGALYAAFNSSYVDYNVVQNGRKGLLLHGEFTVRNALGQPLRMVAEFQFRDGGAITALDPAYRSSNGNVLAVANLTPTLVNSYYKDVKIFVPLSALSVGGRMDLRVRMSLYDVNGKRHFAFGNWINFQYTGGNG